MRSLPRFIFLLILLVTSAGNAWSADGRILNFEGDVRVNGKPVTANTQLHREDTIVTAAGASAKIVLSDNSVLDLESGSEIKLSDYSYNSAEPEKNKSDISIVEGTLRYVSGLIAKEDPDNIRFTAGSSTIGVRGSFTAIEVDGVVVNVEAMIGEATLVREEEGKKDIVVVPTGQTTLIDPATGETLLAPSALPNAVNAVVYAIAAAAPDAEAGAPDDEGCSKNARPLRQVARPVYDAQTATSIADQLTALNEGELMMVMAVLINNARHLCIDASTVASTIGVIATARPEASADVVFVAALLDPESADKFTDSATAAAPAQATKIEQARDDAQNIAQDFSTDNPSQSPSGEPAPPKKSDPPIEKEVPPGGAVGDPPSPE